MQKKVSLIILAVSASACLAYLVGCGASDNVKQPPTNTGRAMIKVAFNFSDEEVSTLPPDFIEVSKSRGYNRTSSGFERILPASEVPVSYEGRKIMTDKDGYFKLTPDITRATKNNSFKIDFDYKDFPLKQSSISRSISTSEFIADINYYEDSNDSSMSCCDKNKTPTRGEPMADIRCLDYNGFFTDGINWDPRISGERIKAFRNFIGSDCENVIVLCLPDHWTKGSCTARHNGCSRFWNWPFPAPHSQNYHSHKL